MLVMADRDSFGGAAFGVEASLVGGVSMLLMLDRESVGEAGGGGEVDAGASFGAFDCFFA